MPIFEEGNDPLRQGASLGFERAPLGPEPDTTPKFAPSMPETIGAAMRLNNPVVNAASLLDTWVKEAPDARAFDPGHNPLETIKGTWAEAHPELFLHSPNEAETRRLIARGEREIKDRETLAAAGWPGVAAGMAAGLLDPTIALIPAGFTSGAARSAMQAAGLGALQGAISEAPLYANQVTRTREEALTSVASSAVLAGVLGGAVGALTPFEREAAERALDDLRRAPGAPVPAGPDRDALIRRWEAANPKPEELTFEKWLIREELSADELSPDELTRARAEFEEDLRYERMTQAQKDAIIAAGGARKQFYGRGAWELKLANDNAAQPDPSLFKKAWDAYDAFAAAEDGPYSREKVLWLFSDETRPEAEKMLQHVEGHSAEELFALWAKDHPQLGVNSFGDMLDAGREKPGSEYLRLSHNLDSPYWNLPERALHDETTIGRAANANEPATPRLSPLEEWEAARERFIRDELPTLLYEQSGVAAGNGGSLSAASADTRSMAQVRTLLPSVADMPSPSARVIAGESVEAKRATTELVETARRFEQEAEGQPKSLWGGAVETVNRLDQRKFEWSARTALRDAWAKHYYGGEMPFAGVERAKIADWRGQAPEGKMDFAAFKEAVYDAAYSGDKHPVPEVAEAAAQIRRDVLEPLAERAKMTLTEDGTPLLDPDTVKPKGDLSFIPRLWNHAQIIAERPRFKETIARWLRDEQAVKSAAKERIGAHLERYNLLDSHISNLEQRLARLAERSKETEARLNERAMEARAAVPREEALKQRAGDLREAVSELEEFISTMRAELRDPDQLAGLKSLEAELAALRKEAKPMSAAELARLEKEEVESVFTGDFRKAAEIAIGKRKPPAPGSLAAWMKSQGGIYDPGGDIQSMLGRRAIPGLLRKERDAAGRTGGRGLDDWAEKIYNDYPEYFPDGRPSPDDVANFIVEDHFGRSPDWWMGEENLALMRDADNLRDAFAALGVEPKSLSEAAQALMGGDPAVLRRLYEKASAAADLPGAEETLAGRLEGRSQLRDLIGKALERRAAREAAVSREGARAQEAGVAARRVKGRIAILEERAARHDQMREIIEFTRDWTARKRAEARAAMEREIEGWQGKSSAEAIRMLKDRREAQAAADRAAVMGRRAEGPVSSTATDNAVDRAVRAIMDSERDLSDLELQDRAEQIIDRILSTPDGRFPYDIASTKPGGEGVKAGDNDPRGSLHSRDFAIPTALVRDFVERDMEHVITAHLRTMLPDIELTRRFGDKEMTSVIKSIREGYNKKIAENKARFDAGQIAKGAFEKENVRLHQAAEADIRDVAAMRDRVRNIYGWSGDPVGRRAHEIARDVRNWTSLASLGGAAVNSLTDFGVNGVMRYGLGTVFKEQWAPFVKSLAGLSDVGKVAKQQAREMGIGVESALGLSRHNFEDIVSNYRPGNAFSRAVSYAADRMHMVNMLGPWTDLAKTAAFVPAQAEFGRAAARIAAGKGTKADIQRMADASIPLPMAKKIAAQIEKHGVTVDGVRFANAGAWEDAEARRIFETAMQREVDIVVTTPGAGDKPLWISTPVGSVLGQFKSFLAGAHERVLVSNLQKRDADTVTGVVAALGLGAASYALYSLGTGQKPSERPQDWIKEAVDRAALTGWFGEINKVGAKLSAGRLDAFRMIGADRPLTRRSNNSGLAELLGPAYSLAEGAAVAGAHAFQGDFQGSDLHRIRKALPLQNLTGFRVLLDQVEAGAASAFGLKPRPHAVPNWEP